MLFAHRPQAVSEADYLALPESMARSELIHGEVCVSPAPTLLHQVVQGRLFARLLDWADRSAVPARVALAPVDIRFGPERILQPDLAVFVSNLPDLEARPIAQVPDLCIEVLSPSNQVFDRVMKRYLYGEAGVREYWLVDPNGHIERCYGQGLTLGEVMPDPVQSAVLPGFSTTWAAIFAR
jgi:Uma2 family endonuclease